MPERVHTKFDNDEKESGLGRFVDELKKSSADSKSSSASKDPLAIYDIPSEDSPKPKGTKRSRDGSPKTADSAKKSVLKGSKSKSPPSEAANGNAAPIDNGVSELRYTTSSNGSISSSKRGKKHKANGVKSQLNGGSNGLNSDVLNTNKYSTDANGQKTITFKDDESDSPDIKSASQPPNQHLLKAKKDQLATARRKLPIWAHRADIRWNLRSKDVLLLVGETGSGKSTQVPQFLISEPWFKRQQVPVEAEDGSTQNVYVGGMIAITEPRRVAATSLAHRVAAEMGSHLGEKGFVGDVGYAVRFDSNMPKGTKIKFLTEGMLLQEMLRDPCLRKYSAVIVDEIHERSVDVDLLTGFLKNIVMGDKKGRGGLPLKVIVMSATANLEGLQRFFSTPAESLTSSGPETPSDERRMSIQSYSSWSGISEEGGLTSPDLVATAQQPTAKEVNGDVHVPKDSADNVAIHHIAGRQHPVNIYYTPEPVPDYMDAMLKTILKCHIQEPLPGDILAFLPGQDDIEGLQKLIEGYAEKLERNVPKIKVCVLYAKLNLAAQQDALKPVKDKRTRKIILATNMAEASLTVPGIRTVIDCGKAKIKQYRARLGLESLLAKPISKSSAIQRKGRAGREAPGKCYRLFTEKDYLNLNQADIPEILRIDIIQAVLTMKARGIKDIFTFPLMDPPEFDALSGALIRLHTLGALDDEGNITDVGRGMIGLPTVPAHARVLVGAADPDADCLLEAIDVISCLDAGDDLFIQAKTEEQREETEEARKDLNRREGDLLRVLTAMQKFTSQKPSDRPAWCKKHLINVSTMKTAMDIRKQLRRYCVSKKLLSANNVPEDPTPFEPLSPERAQSLLKCFLKAFSDKTAILHPDGSYKTTHGHHVVAIHPGSCLYGKKFEAIMFLEHVFTSKSYAKRVSAVQADWILEVEGA